MNLQLKPSKDPPKRPPALKIVKCEIYLIPDISIDKATFSILMGKEMVKKKIHIGIVATKEGDNVVCFFVRLFFHLPSV